MLVCMIRSVFALLLAQLMGEVVSRGLRLPVPGPVVGMALLAMALHLRRRGRPDEVIEMGRMTRPLLGTMGLFFVPAGVGVVASMDLLRRQWVPILAGLVGSTVVAMLMTAWVMEWAAGRRRKAMDA